jgi:transketolase
MTGPAQLDQLAINTIRTLSMDAVQAANSGHPEVTLLTCKQVIYAHVAFSIFPRVCPAGACRWPS